MANRRLQGQNYVEDMCSTCSLRVYPDCWKTTKGVVLAKDKSGRILITVKDKPVVESCEAFSSVKKMKHNDQTKGRAFVFNIHTRKWEKNKKLSK